MIFLYILFYTIAIIWACWLIGYPIYNKVKGRKFFDISLWYPLGLSTGALILNVINLIVQLNKYTL